MLTPNQIDEIMNACYSIQRMEAALAVGLGYLARLAEEDNEQKLKEFFKTMKEQLV